MKYTILSGLLMFFAAYQTMQAQVAISAELRPRTEYLHGYKSVVLEDQDASLITSQRTRLNLDYKNDAFAFGMVLQDVRNWGSEAQLTTNGNNVTYLHQAWGELFITDKFSLKAGRQELIYDDHRIMGNVGWAQQARSHDLALFKYTGDITVHLGLAYNNSNINNSIYDGPDAYAKMQYLWLNRKGSNYTGSFMFLNNGKPRNLEYIPDGGVADQETVYSRTAGTHIVTDFGVLKLTGNLYYQFGEDVFKSGDAVTPDVTKDISAYNVMLDASAGLNETFSVGGGFEILSGTDQTETEKSKSFTPLYGTNHKFNGFMDYFYVGNHINNVGLNDIYVKSTLKLGKFNVNGFLHFFSANGEIIDQDQYLGTELDLTVGYSHKGQVAINAGYSHMFAADAMYAIKGTPVNNGTNNWAFLMLTFKPVFFSN